MSEMVSESGDGTASVALFEGRLSGRHWRQIVRCVGFGAGAVLVAYGIARMVTASGFHPLAIVASFALATLGIGFAVVAAGLIRALISGQTHRQAIDDRGVWAWSPFRPLFVPADRVIAVRPVPRFGSARVDVHVVFRGRLTDGGIDLWTDEGLTHAEFEALRQRLATRRIA
jgi:hypothetical protein